MPRELPDGLVLGADGRPRCWWGTSSDDYRAYHDDEWGRPVLDDHRLFEKICLEGFQSGLSWLTILRKREAFRRAFADFDYTRVARFTDRRVERLLGDAGIVRHRGKILSTINNARRARELAAEYGSLAAYFRGWEPAAADRPPRITKAALLTMSVTPASQALSKDLKRRGWTFVGPTTVYAFMQAMGLVNDHLEGCHVREDVERARGGSRRRATHGVGRTDEGSGGQASGAGRLTAHGSRAHGLRRTAAHGVRLTADDLERWAPGLGLQ